MDATLAATVEEMARTLGPVPNTRARYVPGEGWVATEGPTAAELVEEMLGGKSLAGSEQAWLLRFLLVSVLHLLGERKAHGAEAGEKDLPRHEKGDAPRGVHGLRADHAERAPGPSPAGSGASPVVLATVGEE